MCWKTACASHRDCRWRGKFIPGTNRPLKAMQWHLLTPAMKPNKLFPTTTTHGDKAGYKTEAKVRACSLSDFTESNFSSKRKTMHCEFPGSQEAIQCLLTGCHKILNGCLIAQIQKRCSILSAALWKFTETTHNVQSCHISKLFHCFPLVPLKKDS